MSFSSEVKEELENKIDSAKHCQIAEFAAMMAFGGQVRRVLGGALTVVFTTENEVAARKFTALAGRAFGIGQEGIRTAYEGKKSSIIHLAIEDPLQAERVLMALKWLKTPGAPAAPLFVHPLLVQKECCKRAFIRGAFMAAGSISDPHKFYHYEIVCDYEEDAVKLRELFEFFKLDAKVILRKKNYVVYIKEGNHITDCLNVMGAFVSQMDLYNVMILKGMRNDVNRKVNCETANLNKTVEAAVKQIRDIEYIRDTAGLEILSEGLYEVAAVRLENPDMNLKDLGGQLDPPVGKSGVNHRLRKIGEIAHSLREQYGDGQ